MYKLLLFSDSHRSVDSQLYEERWFPPFCTLFEKIKGKFGLSSDLTRRFLAFFDKMTQESFNKMLKKAGEHKPYNLVIGLGNYTPGANEKGMLTLKTVDQYGEFEKELSDHLPYKRILVWGCHDAGYRFDVSGKIALKIGSERGGVSVESVKSAEKLIGPPFGYFIVGPACFVYLATNFSRNVYKSSPVELQNLRRDQKLFLANRLKKYQGNMLFVLMHDPTALPLDPEIVKLLYSYRKKITAIIHGHMHAEFSAKITRITYGFYRNLCRNFKVICVPASWGMFGIGKGFLILNLYGDGTYSVKKHKI